MIARSRDKRISKLLAREGLYNGDITTTSLEGGLWNDAVRVEAGEDTFVFKTFCEVDTTAFFPNSAVDEARALQRLSGLGVSPEFVALWPEERLLAYKYVSGKTWTNDVAAVAKLLIRKETADPTGFTLGTLTPQALLAEGDEIFNRCNAARPPQRPAPISVSAPSHLSMIHRDIGPNNLVGIGDELRLIDWQCPTMGDLTEDIFSFLSAAFHIVSGGKPLTPNQKSLFFQALDLPANEVRYQLLAPFFSWRMAAYCSWRSETHSDSEIRERYRKAAAAEFELISQP